MTRPFNTDARTIRTHIESLNVRRDAGRNDTAVPRRTGKRATLSSRGALEGAKKRSRDERAMLPRDPACPRDDGDG